MKKLNTVILTAGKELGISQQNNASSFPAVRMTEQEKDLISIFIKSYIEMHFFLQKRILHKVNKFQTIKKSLEKNRQKCFIFV